jgi:hypothetical protein
VLVLVLVVVVVLDLLAVKKTEGVRRRERDAKQIPSPGVSLYPLLLQAGPLRPSVHFLKAEGPRLT